MKKVWITLSLLAGLTVVVAKANSYPNAISVQDAKAQVEQNHAVLVDVREKSEVSEGMAEPAQWYALSSINADEPSFLKFVGKYTGKQLMIYCRSGHRASLVVQKLAAHGIKAMNMGGFQDWAEAGYPTKSLSK